MKKSLIYSKSSSFFRLKFGKKIHHKKIIEPMVVWHQLFEHTTNLVLVIG
jgi:hypothetical protein